VIKKEYSRIFFHNQADNILVIELRSIIKLNMVINLVSFGVSFQQASRLYQSVMEETGMGVMRSISDVEVEHHCRNVCAVNLQYLKEIFKIVWAFEIAIDAGNNA